MCGKFLAEAIPEIYGIAPDGCYDFTDFPLVPCCVGARKSPVISDSWLTETVISAVVIIDFKVLKIITGIVRYFYRLERNCYYFGNGMLLIWISAIKKLA